MVTFNQSAHETEQFLPDEKQVTIDLISDPVKVTIQASKRKDQDVSSYDPFKGRRLPNPTTDGETLAHLLKSCLGTGVLAMPYAFKNGGVVFGIVNTLLVGLICTHCAYILVKCAHKLYYKTRTSSLTFAEIGEVAFANGPGNLRFLAKPARLCIVIGIFLTYFGTCCAYNVVIAGNIKKVLAHYHVGESIDSRWFIAALLPPLIVYNYVPNLKKLAIFSQIANVLMACTIGISFYYIFFVGQPLHSLNALPSMAELHQLPEFFSIVIFAVECIGVVIPLENNMEKPKHFVGHCGVLNIGLSTVTILYLAVGLIGYLKYGVNVEPVITLNLPVEELGSQCAMVFIAAAVFFTYALQFYVCLEIMWNGIKDKISENVMLCNYALRTVLVILSVAIAIAVPEISPFLSIIGALFFGALGILFPAIIELIVFHEDGFGFLYWKVFKNVFICIFGVMAMVFGTSTSVQQIIESYAKKS